MVRMAAGGLPGRTQHGNAARLPGGGRCCAEARLVVNAENGPNLGRDPSLAAADSPFDPLVSVVKDGDQQQLGGIQSTQ